MLKEIFKFKHRFFRGLILIMTALVAVILATAWLGQSYLKDSPSVEKVTSEENGFGGAEEENLHPLSIEYMRNLSYPGSGITIEQILPSGTNYRRYIASYKSDGLKIYGLLTIPNGPVTLSPEGEVGWPVIIFNHGYIPPSQYRTAERYVTYVDAFARNGYIVFKPDYRGHGNSEGRAEGGYGSNAYTIDVLNAVSSVKNLKDPSISQNDNQEPITDVNRIGMWGHSMGGSITLRAMVVSNEIKAGVIWAGVVASYPDLLENWRRRNRPQRTPPFWATSWRQRLIDQYGEPWQNPQFWASISAPSYLKDVSGPLQLHHGTADTSVPIEFSEKLERKMIEEGQYVEYFSYAGDDHNLRNNFNLAIKRSVEFLDRYLKNRDQNR